jgi:prophage regulatory protein
MTKLRRLPWVLETTGDSRSGLYAKMSRGEFPRPVPIGARSVAWQEKLVLAWVEQKIAAAKDYASITVNKAAAEIGIPPEELQPFVTSGALPVYQLGKHKLIKKPVWVAFRKTHEETLQGGAA